jgi:NADPH2:quinone reductase
LFFKRLRMGGVAVGAYANAESRAAWQEVVRLLTGKGAKPLVDSIFSFAELPKAFEQLAQGPMGKVLLQVR